ncbi:class I SAM-dependent methyltransferase [Candidatus Fermentibacterales bacterium]|nr:class I SAM-dependent methyltransferase [Candidatus Fermentibacterales bacterium]
MTCVSSRKGTTEHDRWPEEAFGPAYRLVYGHRDRGSARQEVGHLLAFLGLRGDERVLDVGCGDGRHLEALLEKCREAWGLDLSPWLLERARGRKGLSGRLVRADMRAIPFAPRFDLVTSLFTSFGYFLEDSLNAHVMMEMASCLRPGGVLVVDHINPAWLRSNLIPASRFVRMGYEVLEERALDGNRVVKRVRVRRGGGEPLEDYTESVRLYQPEEMASMFVGSGLGTPRLLGWYDGSPLEQGSRRMIAVGTRSQRCP